MSQAAFALLVKPTNAAGIPVIGNDSGSRMATVPLKGLRCAEVLIACCPLPPRDGVESVPLRSAFEFQLLSTKLRGDCEIVLEYREENDLT